MHGNGGRSVCSRETTSPSSRRWGFWGRHPGRAALAARCNLPARHRRPRVRRCVRRKTGQRSGRNCCPRSPGDELGARGPAVSAPARRVCCGVAGHLPVVGRVRWCCPRLPRGAPFRKLGRVPMVRACTRSWSTLKVALAVVKMEAVRHQASEAPSSTWQTVKKAIQSADLLLVHLSDTKLLSRRLG